MLPIVLPDSAFTITTHMLRSLHRETEDGFRRLEETRSPLLEEKHSPRVTITHAGVEGPAVARSVAGGTAASIVSARAGTAWPCTIESARAGVIEGSNHRESGSTDAPNVPGSSWERITRIDA